MYRSPNRGQNANVCNDPPLKLYRKRQEYRNDFRLNRANVFRLNIVVLIKMVSFILFYVTAQKSYCVVWPRGSKFYFITVDFE